MQWAFLFLCTSPYCCRELQNSVDNSGRAAINLDIVDYFRLFVPTLYSFLVAHFFFYLSTEFWMSGWLFLLGMQQEWHHRVRSSKIPFSRILIESIKTMKKRKENWASAYIMGASPRSTNPYHNQYFLWLHPFKYYDQEFLQGLGKLISKNRFSFHEKMWEGEIINLKLKISISRIEILNKIQRNTY